MRLLVSLLIGLVGFCGYSGSDPAASRAAAGGVDQKKKKPGFTIGKETTFVTGPVDEKGFIDYPAALNERLGQGVSAENNAVVLLRQALGPEEHDKRLPAAFYKALGSKE